MYYIHAYGFCTRNKRFTIRIRILIRIVVSTYLGQCQAGLLAPPGGFSLSSSFRHTRPIWSPSWPSSACWRQSSQQMTWLSRLKFYTAHLKLDQRKTSSTYVFTINVIHLLSASPVKSFTTAESHFHSSASSFVTAAIAMSSLAASIYLILGRPRFLFPGSSIINTLIPIYPSSFLVHVQTTPVLHVVFPL